MTIAVGQRLPDATFKTRPPEGAVPGAFTPTCHAKHLPSYMQHADRLKAKGVDTIACIAVNDAFVLDAWAKSNSCDDQVLMLADGNGTFTRAVGLDFDGSGYGFGTRSKRYSMLVEDGVVKALNVEEAPGIMEVSGADRMLQAL